LTNTKSNLEVIKEKISLLPFNAKQVDFAENKTEIGNLQKIGEMVKK
jgi:hypothetical protein